MKEPWSIFHLPVIPMEIAEAAKKYHTYIAFYTENADGVEEQCIVSPKGNAVAIFRKDLPFFAFDSERGRIAIVGETATKGQWMKLYEVHPWLVVSLGHYHDFEERKLLAKHLNCPVVVSQGPGKGEGEGKRTETLVFRPNGSVESIGWLALKPQNCKFIAMRQTFDLSAHSIPTVRVAAIQAPSLHGDISKNIERLTRLTMEAISSGAKFIVLPETAITGYLSQDLQCNWYLPESGRKVHPNFTRYRDVRVFAEKTGMASKSVRHFAEIAQDNGVYITVPYLEEGNELGGKKKYYNSISLVGPSLPNGKEGEKGRLLAHYRKNCPWPHPEKSWATAGQSTAIADTPYGQVGLAICFDHTEMYARYAFEHPDLWCLLYSIAWVDANPLCLWFHENLPQKLVDEGKKTFHVIGANWGVDQIRSKTSDWYGYGCSVILHRQGAVLAAAESVCGEEIIYADLPYEKERDEK